MSGVNISNLKIEKRESSSKRKKRFKLSELSSSYSNQIRKNNNTSISTNKVVAKQQGSGSKVVAKQQGSGSKGLALKQQSDSKVVAQLVAKGIANYQQSGSKVVANHHFSQLNGLQKNIVKMIYFSCRSNGQKFTQPISIQHIAEITQTTSGTVKNAIHRLTSKGILSKYKFKNGRGGWTQYILSKEVYSEVLQSESDSKVVANYQQSGSKLVAQSVAQLVASDPSSNSIININKKTTTREHFLTHGIQTPENLKNLGFGKGHIQQLQEKFSLSEEQIQQGLEAFSYDLAKGELQRLKARGVQNIIGYFFGAMKSGGYNTVNDGFITAEELGEKETIERLEKRQKERKERKEKLENLLFDEWIETKSKEELINIQKPVSGYLDMFHKAALKEFFKKNEMENFKEDYQ